MHMIETSTARTFSDNPVSLGAKFSELVSKALVDPEHSP